MKHSTIIQSALLAASLLLCTSFAAAAETKAAPSAEAKAAGESKANSGAAKAKKAGAPAKVKLVDINSASPKELATRLPGITAELAEKIVAGRPYLTKAHLVTRNIVSEEVYAGLKTLVIAKQKPEAKAKLAK